nr:MAG TPA: Transcription initiation factor IIE, alpha FINGER, Transcription [Caudoviricetes sp.]
MTDTEYRYLRRADLVNAIGNIIIALMILILVSTIVLGLIFYEDPMTQYNNGIHADDGGRWTYDGFMISKSRSRYSYHCDTCGRSIVLDEWRK